jgi:hypothetical protein
MKKLLYKLAILCLLILGPLVVIILLPPGRSNITIIHDKHQRLVNTESPRIVLAGGSNLVFGIDSKAIQTALLIPVVNMGLNVGIGLGRILDDIAPYLHSGDILVIAPEYHFFTNEWNGSSGAYELILDGHRYSFIEHSPFYGPPSSSGFFPYVKNKILGWIPHQPNPLAYTRDGFNEYGDDIKHLEVENQLVRPKPSIGKINQSYLSAFFRIVDSLVQQGIQVLITYPSYEETSFQNSVDVIHELDAAFRKERNMTVISVPEDYCFSTDYFYDSAYHLNAKGREIRTARLIQDLQHQLEPPTN